MARSEEESLLAKQAVFPSLVVTGSSAGGIDALMAFVSNLPQDFSPPIIIAQHMAPARESRLQEILAQHTSLTVSQIIDEVKIEQGHIYVVPPGHDVELFDSKATTRVRVSRGPKPSIDRLFSSAAAAYGDRLIAIVFSGLGSDGTRGARTVKSAGGTVFIQDPAGASFPSMPLSIPPTHVDVTASPEEMGAMISTLVGASSAPSENGDRKALRSLLSALREQSGVDFTQYKTPTIMRRLSRLMVAAGMGSVAEYGAYLERNPEGYQLLANSFLIKVTEFFRDSALFETLRDELLPKLISEARQENRELRIWSAGTSTGEEAYSLAIVCSELTRGLPQAPNVRIFATDVDDQAIAFARRGIYADDSLQNVPGALVARYFNRLDGQFEVSKQIRNMTVFGQHDLGQRAPFPRIDLVMCRNVLIYFTRELQMRALQLFGFALRDGGYLILGKAESATPAAEYFGTINSQLKIFRREGERAMLPPPRANRYHPIAAPITALDAPAKNMRSLQNTSGTSRAAAHEVIAAYLNASSIGVVIVDRNYDIIAINSSARAMLQIHGAGVGSDLVHLLPGTGSQLRALIDETFLHNSGEPVVLQAKDPITSVDRLLQVLGTRQRQSNAGYGETVGLVILDVTAYENRIADSVAEIARLQSELGSEIARGAERSERVRAMLVANEELGEMNGELREYNEQLLIGAEEAASATEEIETLNEEMQATNEELETLNEELQATIEELNTTNDELTSRGNELQRANANKQAHVDRTEVEKAMLGTALDRAGLVFAIVDPDGIVSYISRSVAEAAQREDFAACLRESATVTIANGQRYLTKISGLDAGWILVTFELVGDECQ